MRPTAALTGLLFVALSLHIRYVATDPVYRSMAPGSLIELVTVLVLSLVALIHQPTLRLGVELTVFEVAYIAIVAPLAWAFQRTATRRTRKPILGRWNEQRSQRLPS